MLAGRRWEGRSQGPQNPADSAVDYTGIIQ